MTSPTFFFLLETLAILRWRDSVIEYRARECAAGEAGGSLHWAAVMALRQQYKSTVGPAGGRINKESFRKEATGLPYSVRGLRPIGSRSTEWRSASAPCHEGYPAFP